MNWRHSKPFYRRSGAPDRAAVAAPAFRVRHTAFTLIEVLLAISIAAGILVVVLLFYHQTESLRSRLLEETSRLAAVRLVMDRLSGELAAARLCQPRGQGLSGTSNTLSFVKLSFPSPWDRTNAPATTTSAPALRVVTYTLVEEDTNSVTDGGLLRSEEALVKSTGAGASAGPGASPSLAVTNDPSLLSLDATNAPPKGAMASQIRFVRFRYWDGIAWSDSWTGPDLPWGVEASLGADPLPADAAVEDYAAELYRRVIYLPNHGTNTVSSLTGPALTQAAP